MKGRKAAIITESIQYGQWSNYFLMSDLHIDARLCDRVQLKRDLIEARSLQAKVFIFGDVFDAIVPQDRKRYTSDCAAAELYGSRRVLNDMLDLATDTLRPYADMIHVISSGNHEEAILKHHGLDLISILVDRLSCPAHVVHYGQQHGGWIYLKRSAGPKVHRPYRIYYHHGAGGASPVSKGMINFARMDAFIGNADLIALGHSHALNTDDHCVLNLNQSGVETVTKRKHVRCGTYLQSYDDGPSYASQRNMAPTPVGCVRLKLMVRSQDAEQEVRVEH